MTYKKKMIEVALPLEVVNRASVREKGIRQGHPSTLHLWWARRPLAAARAVLFAQMVDDPSSRPERFPTAEAQQAERERLFDLIERLVLWENTSDKALMEEAHIAIGDSGPRDLPAVVDPFAGGGSIPLEAKRLGLDAYANDLNPLAALINTVLLDLVDRFAVSEPTTGGLEVEASSAPSAIAADLRFWSKRLEERVRARMHGRYPASSSGGVPLVFFWARTVTCPNPACGIEIPLVGQWKASGRKGNEAMFVPKPSPDGQSIDVEVRYGRHSAPPSTLQRTSGQCPTCGSGFPLAYVKQEGMSGRMGARMLAVQERLNGKRYFRPATEDDREAAAVPAPDAPWLSPQLSTHSQYMAPPRYGLTTFRDLFLPRQLAMLTVFTEELETVAGEAMRAASQPVGDRDTKSFNDGGRGARAYGDAMRILLAIGVSRLVNRASSLCIWHANANKVEQVFSMQAYKMTWLFAEANPFGGASGSFSGQVDYLAKVIEGTPTGTGHVTQGPAQELVLERGVVVSTDPPYYDAVPYADLSDFFLVWLRHMLAGTLPNMFPTVLSPKTDELVADSKRHHGKENAAKFFEEGMREVFRRIREVHSREYPMTVYYAFKTTENAGAGGESTGWETFLQALVDSGWAITGTWPIRTEQAGGLRELGRNALASSVVVVCRSKDPAADTVNRKSFISALRRELPAAMRLLQQGAVAPVDLAQAAIGPGMAIFTRFARVVEADGSDMTVRTALALINQSLDETLAEQEGDFDADTRFCIKWFSQFGWNEGASGEADVLARATNTAVTGLVRGGVFRAVAGKARLLAPEELSADWDPLADERVSVWEVVVRLAHALTEVGVDGAAPLFASAGQRVDLDTAQELAYLLFALCEKKGWTESARLFNALGSSWSDVTTASRSLPQAEGTQSTFDFDDDEGS